MANKIFEQLASLAASFFAKKISDSISSPAQTAEVRDMSPDWSDPKSKLSKNFSVGEALLLPSWGSYHVPSEEEKKAILAIANRVTKVADKLTEKLGKQIRMSVHAWMRPERANIPGSKWNGMDYNRWIYENQVWAGLSNEEKAKKKVPNSPHKTGHAIDFHVIGWEGKEKCAEMRKLILPFIEEFGLRMENIEGGWIHLDDLPVINNRFFKP